MWMTKLIDAPALTAKGDEIIGVQVPSYRVVSQAWFSNGLIHRGLNFSKSKKMRFKTNKFCFLGRVIDPALPVGSSQSKTGNW